MFGFLLLFLTHIHLPPLFFPTYIQLSPLFSHIPPTFSCLHFFTHTFRCLLSSHTFSCLPLFLTHFHLSPLSSHTHSVVSPLFSHTCSIISLFSLHTFSCLHLFLTHLQFPPFFSHIFSCLHFLIHIPLSPFFLMHVQFPPPFSHTHSVPSLFFLTLSVAFGIHKKTYSPLSVTSTFFPHLSVLSLLFLTHLQLSPLFSHPHSVPSSLFFPHFQLSCCLPLFSHFLPFFSQTFSCLSVVSFFLTCSVPSTFFSH